MTAEPADPEAPSHAANDAAPDIRGHLLRLDGLRGLAILLVMVVHFWRAGDGSSLGAVVTRVARLGWMGVDLFFVLSGFLITGILIDSREKHGYLRNFWARRVLRIFPLYYLFLAVSLLLMPAYFQRIGFARYPGFGHAADALAWPWYITYTSNVWMALHGDFSHGLANSLTWSLAIEEQFYFIWPWLVLLCPPRRLIAAMAAVFSLAVAFRLALVLLGSGWLPILVLTPGRVDALAAGSLLAAYLRLAKFEPRAWQALVRAGLYLALPAAVVWGVLAPGDVRESRAFQGIGYSLVALGCAALLAKVLGPREGRWQRAFQGRFLISFGKYSYGIYLFHVLLFTAVYPIVYKPVLAFLGLKILERIFWLVAGVAGSWLLAFVLYHLYEVRFLRLKRYFESEPPAPTLAPALAVTEPDAAS